MVSKIKIVILTSKSLRHKYIANRLAEVFDVELIVTENKSPKIEDTSNLNNDDELFIKNHFLLRAKSEDKYFGGYKNFPLTSKIEKVPHGEINSEAVFTKIKSINPDRIILFGTSIIKKPLISYFNDKIINLHLGLSPYYKGSATNIFPIYFKDIAGIGATIHIATQKVDEGPILHQLRPKLLGYETIHDIGNKVIKKAGEVLPIIIRQHFKRLILGKIQKDKGIVCKISDLSVSVLREVYKNIEDGLVLDSVNQEELFKQKPIIECL